MRARPAASSASGARLALLVRHGGRADRLPAAFGLRDQLPAVPWHVARTLAAGMGELHRDRGLRMLAHRGEDRLQRRFGGVVPQPEAARRDAADILDMGRLDAEHRGARQRQIVDMGEMPVIGLAIFGRVLAHRRHHDAVGKRQAAQLDRGEQSAHAGMPRSEEKDARPMCSEAGLAPQPSPAATLPYGLIPAALINSALARVSRFTRSSVRPRQDGPRASVARLALLAGFSDRAEIHNSVAVAGQQHAIGFGAEIRPKAGRHPALRPCRNARAFAQSRDRCVMKRRRSASDRNDCCRSSQTIGEHCSQVFADRHIAAGHSLNKAGPVTRCARRFSIV